MNPRSFWARPTSLWVFFASAVGWFLVGTLLWMQVSVWTSYPVAGLANVVLEKSASYWVRSVQVLPGRIEVETRIQVAMAGSRPNQGVAELVAEGDPAHYGYGLPLFLALLLAARSRQLWKKALLGYLLLLLPQTFSLVMNILKQIMVAGGRPGALAIDQWQMEAIALGYQTGSLLVPTLAPVALWLWLERDFFNTVVVNGWLQKPPAAAQTNQSESPD